MVIIYMAVTLFCYVGLFEPHWITNHMAHWLGYKDN